MRAAATLLLLASLPFVSGCSRRAAAPATKDAGPPPAAVDASAAEPPPAVDVASDGAPGLAVTADLPHTATFTQVSSPPPGSLNDPSLVVPAPLECGGEPCCGDPPQPCGLWIENQKEKNGLILIQQPAPEGCAVFLDGEAWAQGRRYGAFQFVPPGPHVVECRMSDGSVLSRPVEAAIGQETGVRWSP